MKTGKIITGCMLLMFLAINCFAQNTENVKKETGKKYVKINKNKGLMSIYSSKDEGLLPHIDEERMRDRAGASTAYRWRLTASKKSLGGFFLGSLEFFYQFVGKFSLGRFCRQVLSAFLRRTKAVGCCRKTDLPNQLRLNAGHEHGEVQRNDGDGDKLECNVD